MKSWRTIICLIFSLSVLFTPLAQAGAHTPKLSDHNVNNSSIPNISYVQDMASDIDSCKECIDHSNAVICLDFCLSMAPAILVENTLNNQRSHSDDAYPHLEQSVGLFPAVEISPPINL
ncbi:hypothetical protein [Kiloniella sp.]|uniref:hypothetical protein n=1 Tax=Kiloniella sp. TaxID=1938587 RepID=UPI003A8D6708